MCFGCECGDGWFMLLDELCSGLQWNTDKNGYPQVVAVQVKEKFGGLRFYYNAIGGEEDKRLERKVGCIDGRIGFAEAMSYKICEECGSTDDVTQSEGGWVYTRCAKCWEEE